MSESEKAFKVIFVAETEKAARALRKYEVELSLRSSFHEDLEDGGIQDIKVIPISTARGDSKKELVAKLKFWFGSEIKDLFNEEQYIVETKGDFVYIYTK